MNKLIQNITQYLPLVAGLVVSRIVPHPADLFFVGVIIGGWEVVKALTPRKALVSN